MIESKNPKKVFVYGDFYVLHPGHVRFLKFAASCGDQLYIGVNNSQPTPNYPTPQERIETLNSLELNSHSFIIETSLEQVLNEIKPDILVKGKEHEKNDNPEISWISKWNGKIVFASGDSTYFTGNLISQKELDLHSHWIKPTDYLARHDCDPITLKKIVDGFNKLKVIVIGDLIIDEYVNCDALGMSREDPTLVVSPKESKKFLGGAGIVASHAQALGADVDFISIAGDDLTKNFAEDLLAKYKVKCTLFKDLSRPTTLKQRYRVADKTMLRVSHLRQHEISQEIASAIEAKLRKTIPHAQVLLFADFNYGCLPQKLVINLIQLAKKHGLVIGADSQSSSQIGDISRYVGATFVTPTEHEARLALRDSNSGLQHIGNELIKKISADAALITLGASGVLVVTRENDATSGLMTDLLPALNPVPIDTSGAGDSLLTVTSLALANNLTPYQAAYLGSLGAAIQVARIGNTPITANELKGVID
jgi:rfaE bifunctional protein kinase chain/domain